jgi:hypothetical protein
MIAVVLTYLLPDFHRKVFSHICAQLLQDTPYTNSTKLLWEFIKPVEGSLLVRN